MSPAAIRSRPGWPSTTPVIVVRLPSIRRTARKAKQPPAAASTSVSSSGLCVSTSMKARAARSSGRSGAVLQSATTAFQTSSPSAYDATAPWEAAQNGH